jgi:hypothetical protein
MLEKFVFSVNKKGEAIREGPMVEDHDQMSVRFEVVFRRKKDQVAWIRLVTSASLRDDMMFFPTLGDDSSVEVQKPMDRRLKVMGSVGLQGDESGVEKEGSNLSLPEVNFYVIERLLVVAVINLKKIGLVFRGRDEIVFGRDEIVVVFQITGNFILGGHGE